MESASTYLIWAHIATMITTLGWWFWVINASRGLTMPSSLSVAADPLHGPSGPRPFLTGDSKHTLSPHPFAQAIWHEAVPHFFSADRGKEADFLLNPKP